jgi:putative Mg2+ transporter-C (MgtC) family protein
MAARSPSRLPSFVFTDPGAVVALRLVAATLAGALIGLNRELRHKPAGLRTHALVALGAATAVALVATPADSGLALHADALSRVLQGIITGIGFLGAGVILRAEGGLSVHGLTTAASIWLAACIGAACGGGAWPVAVAALVLVMLVLIGGRTLESWALRRLARSPPSHDLPPAP